ncbi:hypothetical protein [Streptomyces sp. NPDC002619]|uniref:hypothetical protein n=1 Tax=Streptomyces sp. NPDC002619 TaxID=3364655 RepID=UPI0036CF3C4B
MADRIGDITDIDDWQSFLVRWSEEWADAQSSDSSADERPTPDEEPQRMRWLGFPPAAVYGHHVAAVRLVAAVRVPDAASGTSVVSCVGVVDADREPTALCAKVP